MTLVLGVDGCRAGWCCVAVEVSDPDCRVLNAVKCASFEEILESAAILICIDIPIGLLDGPGHRTCDIEARRLLGRGWPRVFPPPSRAVLADKELASFFLGTPVALGDVRRLHRRACYVSEEATGLMINLQSFYIAPKVYHVDSLMTPALQERVMEAHPEVCFWALNGSSPLNSNKKTETGRQERWRLLRRVLSGLPREASLPAGIRGRCVFDDYADALVCAWTAACVLRGTASRIPTDPPADGRGLRMEMWHPAPRSRKGPAAPRR